MQKLIQRTVQAEKQAARRLLKKKQKAHREWAKTDREQALFRQNEASQNIQQAKLNRREDWELGPLAPNRDVGDMKDKYGTIHQQRMRGDIIPTKDWAEVMKPFGGKFLNIVRGDRVVLLEGRDKGKIGVIREVDVNRAECSVEGLNKVDVEFPKYMIQAEDPDKRPVRSIEKPVPLSSVRLVFPLLDQETGKTRDVIVKQIVNTKVWHDRRLGITRWSRIIPGLNIKIPWPKKAPKEHKEYPCDTLRLDVEAITFVPTLLRPPMPMSVIDELRNKYSKFRTRHDPEYIAKIEAQEEEKNMKKKKSASMRTPLKELHLKERKEKLARGKGTLTPEMLERIGKAIAKKRQQALEAAGLAMADSDPGSETEPVAV